jgi:hypothetical protein
MMFWQELKDAAVLLLRTNMMLVPTKNNMNAKKGTPATAGECQKQKGDQQWCNRKRRDVNNSNSRIAYSSMNAKNSIDPDHGRRNLKTPTP